MKDQQDNAVITVGLVEDLLVGVILGTGDKDAGWGETAEKLAEILEPVRELNLKSFYINKQIYNFFWRTCKTMPW